MTSVQFNTHDYLDTDEAIAAYLDAALEDGDPAVLLLALREVAKAKGGIAALAREADVSRESLYRTLSAHGNPKLETLSALLDALGLRLSVTARKRDEAA